MTHHNHNHHDGHYGDSDGDVERDDVMAREDAHAQEEEELPAPQTTRNMLAMFQSMEDVNRPPPTPEYAQQLVKQASSPKRTLSIRRGASPPPQPHHNTALSSHYSNHYNGHDEQEQQQQQQHRGNSNSSLSSSQEELYRDYDHHGGEFENDPQRNPEVMREGDVNETEVLPEEGTTKNLLAKFQALTAWGGTVYLNTQQTWTEVKTKAQQLSQPSLPVLLRFTITICGN